jgi:thiamine kinase-like enzyme
LGLSPRHPGSRQAAIRLIDYEYSGFNPVAFDIANHW